MNHHVPLEPPEPRWPAIVAAVVVAGLYLAMPRELVVGPQWLQLVVISALLVPTIITHRIGHHALNKVLGHVTSGVMTIFMIWSVGLLVTALPSHKETPVELLRSAGALWLTNVLVFALWYWRLDAGGPHGRDLRPGHDTGAFLFPQMTLDGKGKTHRHVGEWSPRFIDYVFVSFNTSTAFSPTDAPVLSRWAKVLTMIQSAISLMVVAVLAARAINTL